MPYKNKEDAKRYTKKYWLANQERLSKDHKKYYEKNKEKILAHNKEYCEKNKEKIKMVRKKYVEKNKEKIAAYMRIVNAKPERIQARVYYTRLQRKINPNWRIRHSIARRVLHALKGKQKSKSTLKLLGCTIEELWLYLEKKFQPGMTRKNHGEWHVDHIIPCATFDLTLTTNQEKCFHYSNLQPLWAIDNCKKGSRYEKNRV